MTHIKKIDLNITQENILSFNSASQKLNEIFEEYKNLLKRLENEPGEVKSNYFLPLNNKEKEAWTHSTQKKTTSPTLPLNNQYHKTYSFHKNN